MTVKEVFIAITIHLLIPIAGLFYFIRLTKKIWREKINRAPIVELFVVFANYGALLLVILTTLFWRWSAMASLGSFYLILVAPIVMGVIAYGQKKLKGISKYHRATYYASLFYAIGVPILSLILFIAGLMSLY